MAFCSNCGANIKEGGKFCPGCGKAVSAVSSEPIAPVAQPLPADEEDTTHCSNCGEKLKRGVVFCSRCGTKQNEIGKTKMFCSKCGSEIADGIQFCSKCGNAVNPTSMGTANVTDDYDHTYGCGYSSENFTEEEDPYTHCTNCGEKLKKGVVFCSRCGTKQNESRSTKTFCSKCGAEITDGIRFCPKCGNAVNSTIRGTVNTTDRERHGFTSFWLILSLIFNLFAAATSLFYPEWLAEYSEISSGLMMLSGFLLIIGSIECILLLCWKKIGFWILIGNSVISMIINLVDGENIGMVLFGLVSILIWWAILQIRKNGRSTWEQLE
jgi:predicted amidophosphoribosyltransferase